MNDFLSFLSQAVSPAHAVDAASQILEQAGFARLEPAGQWEIAIGGKYYVPFYYSAMLAFTVGERFHFRIAGAHTDWPCLRVKPAAEQLAGGCCKLNIEPYGGAIYSTWLDRPLSLAGLVSLKTEALSAPELRLVAFEEPLLTIPNLAIHLNREVNKGVELRANIDLLPILRTVADGWEKDGYLLSLLAEKLKVSAERILDYDLYIYNTDAPALIGPERDLLSAPRLDNLSSVYACVQALSQSDGDGINAAVLYDHEEIGSNTKQGADSAMLDVLLEKLAFCLKKSRREYLDARMQGLLLSCDVAHAAHPNHMELSDPSCQSYLGRGVTLKLNYSQRYPTELESQSIIQNLCTAANIPFQRFMNRADLRGGSTIGAMASALLTMRTVDVGVPLLAMHSARELMAVKDEIALVELLKAFYRRDS